MEQGVWLAFGIIAVLVGFTIVATVISSNTEETKVVKFRQSLEQMKDKCDKVCDSPLDTKRSERVILPSGIKIETNGQRICGHLNISHDYDDVTKCVVCDCDVRMSQPLDLTSDQARELFETREYFCSFLRKDNAIEMECQG